MYDSVPKEREGEQIEEVLPAAIYTTSSTGNSVDHTGVPARNPRVLLAFVANGGSGSASMDGRGRAILALAVLCAVLLAMLCLSLVL